MQSITDSFVTYTVIVVTLTWLFALPIIGLLHLIGLLQ